MSGAYKISFFWVISLLFFMSLSPSEGFVSDKLARNRVFLAQKKYYAFTNDIDVNDNNSDDYIESLINPGSDTSADIRRSTTISNVNDEKKSVVFVGNLPFSCTKADLETLASVID